ncbi:hypothetical protein GF325_09730 [Candidatus Bathyarchaeota archaeon]|nr:hypothetical protein [Candidatus Bathyarchaeota archaeon]
MQIQDNILEKNSMFWDTFLEKLGERIPSMVFKEAHEILKGRNLSFQAGKLEPYF